MVGKVAAILPMEHQPVNPCDVASERPELGVMSTAKAAEEPPPVAGSEAINYFSYKKLRSDAGASSEAAPPLNLNKDRPASSRETLATDADTTLGSSTSNSDASPVQPRQKTGIVLLPPTGTATTPVMYTSGSGAQQSLQRPEDEVHFSNLSLRDMFTNSEEEKEGTLPSTSQPEDDNPHYGFFPSFDDEGTNASQTLPAEPSSNVEQQLKQPSTDEKTATAPSKITTNRRISTPPSSLDVTPTDMFSRPGPSGDKDPLVSPPSSTLQDPKELELLLPPPAAAAATSVSPAGSNASSLAASGGQRQHQHPMLYSAIGSLEDPSSTSYGRYYLNNATKRPAKVDFPSSKLLPPQSARQTKSLRARMPTVAEKKRASDATERMKTPTVSNASYKADTSRDSVASAGDLATTRADSLTTAAIPSSLRSSKSNSRDNSLDSKGKKVTITEDAEQRQRRRARRRKKKTSRRVEMFRPFSDAYTPRMGKKEIKYKPAEMRTPVQEMAAPLGTLSRPNFKDALRRVAMILRQHIVKIEHRFEDKTGAIRHAGLFSEAMKQAFSEEAFASPTYKCTMVRVPMARPGMVYGLKMIRKKYDIPSEAEIYEFGHQLFQSVQLSSECSIVCLIYVERLMEIANVPLLATTWRPIFMCGLLLASKVWQDLSSWNIEFSTVYPQFSLDSINRLELQFLRMVKWDLYISSSLYAKYYFALRSLLEKPDFRQRYNRMVGGIDTVEALEALKIEQRSSMVKEEALSQLSRSM